jgi:hypothetical protein
MPFVLGIAAFGGPSLFSEGCQNGLVEGNDFMIVGDKPSSKSNALSEIRWKPYGSI